MDMQFFNEIELKMSVLCGHSRKCISRVYEYTANPCKFMDHWCRCLQVTKHMLPVIGNILAH